MPYVLVSLKHTQKKNLFITLWGRNNSGYCYSSENCGIYKELQEDYHDTEHTLPVEIAKISKLFIEAHWDKVPQKMIPNCQAVWNELGLKMTNNGLVRMK